LSDDRLTLGHRATVFLHLRHLHLKLTSLPPEIGQLTTLTALYLHGNQLASLPPEIGQLTTLTTLDLQGNQLASLPPEIGQLTTLTELYLQGNEKLAIPKTVLGFDYAAVKVDGVDATDPRVILDFYFSRTSGGEAPLQELRLLLVGRGRVGKTTVLKALRDEQPDAQEPETPGICVCPLPVRGAKGEATANAWDFGGQEFLHGTHQIFLADRCLYLLVLSGRESNWETESDYWLRFIESFGGDSPVIVVLTKFDEHPFSVDRHRLQERCPQISGFVECDSFTGRGIDDLRRVIAETVDQMDDVWLPIPTAWRRVKQNLEATAESFLEYREYQSLCLATGVDDARKQDSLAQTLHRLGVALNFRDHPRLRDTSVLKPEWVTEAVYGLIRYVQQRESNGVMPLAWMADALPSDRYPEEKHAYVLSLMERFEVAFQLEGTDTWLIPELLNEVQPTSFEEFRGPDAKRLRFHYPDALPPGLLPRLIVRTHELSNAQPEWRWRSGVVLRWGDSSALVRLNRNERRTEVEVIGGDRESQLALFDLIRAHLTVLHGKVRVDEQLELADRSNTWVGAQKLRLMEASGIDQTIEETREHELANVVVAETLDGVESREARSAGQDSAPRRMRLFVSYAHADEKLIKPLSTHLTILGRRGYIQAWQDTMLIAGEEWEERIFEELDRADIVLLLYSTASRASGFIQEKEAPRAVERARSGAKPCTLITVPLNRNDWDKSVALEHDLVTYQAATFNNRPISKFKPQSDGWLEVERAIREAVKSRRSSVV
ncbi:MAG: COR domain-containing protein, partial [Planctomycetota bacterium]